MAQMNNLESLTNQIYQEGIEKAEASAKEILSEAEKKKEALVREAQETANKIVSEAKRDSENLKRSVENELQLKGKQLISDFKNEVIDLLEIKIIDDGVSKAFADADFFKSLIGDVVSHWSKSEELEMVLPESFEKKVDASFQNSILQSVPNLTINFNGKFEGGFRIAKKKESFQISFSEEDFIALFRSYLTEKASKILFENPE